MKYESTPRPTTSPWGAPQRAQELAPGIWSVDTASHGGIKLSPARNAAVPAYMRLSSGWYEEDCDWSRAALAHPEAFTAEQQDHARASLRRWAPDAYEKFTGETLKPGESFARDEAAFYANHAADWLACSAWGDWAAWVPAGMVGVCARTGANRSGGPETWWLIPAEEYRTRGAFPFVVAPLRHAQVNQPDNPGANKPRAQGAA